MGLSLQIGFGVSNVIVPAGGPRVIPANLDFTNVAAIDIDGQQIIDTGGIQYIQGVFIDNGDNAAGFTLEIGGTNQRIKVAPNTQGYYPIMVTNPPKMIARTVQLNGRIVPVFFYNVPIQAVSWKSL